MKTENKHDIVNGFDFTALPIKVNFVGFVNEKEWPHFLWNVSITHKGWFYTTQYKTGVGLVVKKRNKWDETIPLKPENADIMRSLLLDAEAANESFNNWCSDYGYDNDSIRAFKTYQACCEIAVTLNKCFTREQQAAMREALQDF